MAKRQAKRSLRQYLSVLTVAACLVAWEQSTMADAHGKDVSAAVHNGPLRGDRGYVTVPWSPGQTYQALPSITNVDNGTAHEMTVAASHTTVKRKFHFKTKASKERFLRWYYAMHHKSH